MAVVSNQDRLSEPSYQTARLPGTRCGRLSGCSEKPGTEANKAPGLEPVSTGVWAYILELALGTRKPGR